MKTKEFNITTYKSNAEIENIIQRLGDRKLTKTSHTFLEFGDISILESSLKSTSNYSDFAREKPALGLLSVILAANRDFNKVVEPHLIRMGQTDLRDLKDLLFLIQNKTKEEFFLFWGHKDDKKYNTLINILSVIEEFRTENPQIKDDFLLLNNWAVNADLSNYQNDKIGKIYNVAVATFQHLRMVFGVDTVKPDQRVKEVLSYEFGLPRLSDQKAIQAVEQIAEITNHKVIMIDQILVKYGSGYYNQKSDKLTVREVARNLKNYNVDIEIISKSTNLSKAQIKLL